MKTITGFLMSLLLSGLAIAGEQPTSTLTVTRADGSVQSSTDAKDLLVKFWLQQLALSALYRMDVASATSTEWQQAANFRSRIHCRYPDDSHIALPERQLLTFEEMIVPLPERGYPDFIYLKHGEHYSRLTKYDPWIFWKLEVEAGFADEIPDTITRALF